MFRERHQPERVGGSVWGSGDLSGRRQGAHEPGVDCEESLPPKFTPFKAGSHCSLLINPMKNLREERLEARLQNGMKRR